MSGLPRDYWCHIPLENLTAIETRSLLPNTTDWLGDSVYDKCRMFNVNYTDPLARAEIYAGSNGSIPTVPCQYGWEYDHSEWEATVATEWDLVCDKGLYVTIAYTINGAGGILSMFYVGFIADHYGRKACYFITFGIMMLASVATPLSPNYLTFCISRFFAGTGVGWSYTLPMMIAMEIIGPQPRVFMTVIVSVYYTAGILFVGGVSYILNSWRPFAWASSIPLLPFFGLWWVMPESPRWLLSQRKFGEVAEFIRKIGRINKKPLESGFDEDLPGLLRQVWVYREVALPFKGRQLSAVNAELDQNAKFKDILQGFT